jgi:hypothetical protein
MAAYEQIESGGECERFAPIVEALAAGTATARQVLSIRPHIRHCAACKAAVRDLHLSLLQRASLFSPMFAALEPLGRSDALDRLSCPSLDDRLRELSVEAPPAPPADAIPVPQVTDGGLQIPLELPPVAEPVEHVGRLDALRHDITAFFHRAQASDVATGIHVASTSGGGRIATIAAAIGFCLSSVGVGTVCVVSGLVPSPLNLIGDQPPGQSAQRVTAAKPRTAQPTATPTLIRATPPPVATATAAPQRERKPRRAAADRDPSQGTKPTSQESAPITEAPADSSGQETFTPEVPQASSPPTRAPATGGSEFAP